jgi:hypothetical protein
VRRAGDVVGEAVQDTDHVLHAIPSRHLDDKRYFGVGRGPFSNDVGWHHDARVRLHFGNREQIGRAQKRKDL